MTEIKIVQQSFDKPITGFNAVDLDVQHSWNLAFGFGRRSNLFK